MKIDFKWSLVIAAFLLLLVQRCHYKSELSNKVSEYEEMSSFYASRDSANLNKLKLKASDSIKMSQRIVEYESLNESLKNELEGYKGASFVESSLTSGVTGLTLPFRDTIYIDSLRLVSSGCEYADSLIKAFQNKKNFFNFKDEWLTIDGVSSYESISFDSIVFKNEIDVILGNKREKWYKSRAPVVELKSYSPYSNIVYMNNLVVEDKRTVYQKALTSKSAWFLYGILGGFVLNSNMR